MRLLIAIVVWLLLYSFAPLLALAVLVLLPIAWLLGLPLRAIGLVAEAALQLLRAILLLPARLLGGRDRR